MQITLSPRPTFKTDASHVSKNFTILMVYEDYEAGQHAKRIYDHLADQLSTDLIVTQQMWKFDTLSIPKLREMAMKDAAQADILIVAGQGSELSPEIRSWIESWARKPLQTHALVALFHEQAFHSDALPACEFLAKVAKHLGIDFFAYPGTTQFPNHRLEHSKDVSFNALADAVETAYPHWGIND